MKEVEARGEGGIEKEGEEERVGAEKREKG